MSLPGESSRRSFKTDGDLRQPSKNGWFFSASRSLEREDPQAQGLRGTLPTVEVHGDLRDMRPERLGGGWHFRQRTGLDPVRRSQERVHVSLEWWGAWNQRQATKEKATVKLDDRLDG